MTRENPYDEPETIDRSQMNPRELLEPKVDDVEFIERGKWVATTSESIYRGGLIGELDENGFRIGTIETVDDDRFSFEVIERFE